MKFRVGQYYQVTRSMFSYYDPNDESFPSTGFKLKDIFVVTKPYHEGIYIKINDRNAYVPAIFDNDVFCTPIRINIRPIWASLNR